MVDRQLVQYSSMPNKRNWLVSGFGLEACFLLGVGYTRNTTTAITCLTIAVGVSGFAISGMSFSVRKGGIGY